MRRRCVVACEPATQAVEAWEQHAFVDIRLIELVANLPLERCRNDDAATKIGMLREHPALVRRIVIPAEAKWEIRDKLDQANINERVLFPGLDGLSRWLARYYWAKPGVKARLPRAPRPRVRAGTRKRR